jgi:hypothetical protein
VKKKIGIVVIICFESREPLAHKTKTMPLLDFSEISRADIANGAQDTFEMFAREFLELFGFRTVSGPDRGADLGRDLVVEERRTGVAGETIVRWLVSCKHKAHSGESVRLADEADILDRIRVHDCTGFIGCYSTLPASSLTVKLEALKSNTAMFDFKIFDRAKIESVLLSTGPGQGIAERYFPVSYRKWNEENFNIDLAMLRIGMPQPVSYRLPDDDKILTLEEALKLYPQGNRYIFNPWLPFNLILCNNILGITKILDREKGPIDPPLDYFQRMNQSIALNIEELRRQRHEGEGQAEAPESVTRPSSLTKKDVRRKKMSKESRRRNRK